MDSSADFFKQLTLYFLGSPCWFSRPGRCEVMSPWGFGLHLPVDFPVLAGGVCLFSGSHPLVPPQPSKGTGFTACGQARPLVAAWGLHDRLRCGPRLKVSSPYFPGASRVLRAQEPTYHCRAPRRHGFEDAPEDGTTSLLSFLPARCHTQRRGFPPRGSQRVGHDWAPQRREVGIQPYPMSPLRRPEGKSYREPHFGFLLWENLVCK